MYPGYILKWGVWIRSLPINNQQARLMSFNISLPATHTSRAGGRLNDNIHGPSSEGRRRCMLCFALFVPVAGQAWGCGKRVRKGRYTVHMISMLCMVCVCVRERPRPCERYILRTPGVTQRTAIFTGKRYCARIRPSIGNYLPVTTLRCRPSVSLTSVFTANLQTRGEINESEKPADCGG